MECGSAIAECELSDPRSAITNPNRTTLTSLPMRARLDSHKEETVTNRTYEVMYIVNPDSGDDKIAKLNEAVEKLVVKEGGSVVRVDDIGRKRLAYPINKKEEGYYVLFEIEGTGQEIAELERRMRVNDMIIRFMTVRVDEDRKAAEKFRAKREERASKRTKFRQPKEPAGTAAEAQ